MPVVFHRRHMVTESRPPSAEAEAREHGGAIIALLAVMAVGGLLAVLLPAAVLVSAAADCDPSQLPTGPLAESEIPADYLVHYQRAASGSGVPWAVLAAIGWLETRHGTLDAPGVRSGSNHAGAAGPMQFGIGGRAGNTWGGAPTRAVPPQLAYGLDGDSDGIADVYNPADAIPAAAGYLVANGAPDDLRRALYAYNRAHWYVQDVLEKATAYADGAVVATAAGYVPAGCSDPYASSAGGSGQWGGHRNGRIPVEELCPIDAEGRHLLRCDAAQAFLRMNAAHQAVLGRRIPITDAYRTYAEQVILYGRKPHLAATPGTSNHGWGLALDLGVGGWSGTTFGWLQANAATFGWHHPQWARRGGPKPESWHWEFTK